MNTYYIKQDNGAYNEVTFSNEMLISMVIDKHIKEAIFNSTSFINSAISRKIDNALQNANIQGKVIEHLGSMDIHERVNDAVSNAINEYDYDGVIENALDDVDIDEMVRERVTDHLDSSSIQVKIN